MVSTSCSQCSIIRSETIDINVSKQTASAVVDLQIGVESGRIRWECLGNEETLFDCQRHNNSCTNDSAAGVACFG